ncbi:alpha/beta hydrolase [Pseudomonas sp. NCHU5208]|uniref:alpha/beta hydrolase n=1 Tax=unclassified Pseudomonas TaxID=196821 RepID=UPI003F977742
MTASADFVAPVPGQKALRLLLRALLRVLFRGLIRPPMPVAGQRLILRALTAVTLVPGGVQRSRETLAGVPCEWHRPPGQSERVVLYLHGGAFMIGGPNTHRGICASLAKRGGFALCALDYRLAPEHPFPAARDDVLAAYRALLESGYSAAQIAFAGDSAGGNLCLVACLQAQQQGLPAPAALLCLSPVADLSGASRHDPPAGDPLLHPRWLQQAVELYRPAQLTAFDPRLSPLYADLAGLPPLLLQVGEDELLRNDSLRLAERVRAAGGEVRLERYPQLWHVFQAHVGLLRAADQAIERIIDFLRERGW